jgi:hypothetical protein
MQVAAERTSATGIQLRWRTGHSWAAGADYFSMPGARRNIPCVDALEVRRADDGWARLMILPGWRTHAGHHFVQAGTQRLLTCLHARF